MTLRRSLLPALFAVILAQLTPAHSLSSDELPLSSEARVVYNAGGLEGLVVFVYVAKDNVASVTPSGFTPGLQLCVIAFKDEYSENPLTKVSLVQRGCAEPAAYSSNITNGVASSKGMVSLSGDRTTYVSLHSEWEEVSSEPVTDLATVDLHWDAAGPLEPSVACITGSLPFVPNPPCGFGRPGLSQLAVVSGSVFLDALGPASNPLPSSTRMSWYVP